MTIVVIGMLVCLALAAAILLVVALPKFHEGAPLLTEEGEDAVREAQRRARFLAARARRRARQARERAQQARDRAQQVADQAGAARDRMAEQAVAAREHVAAVRGERARARAERRDRRREPVAEPPARRRAIERARQRKLSGDHVAGARKAGPEGAREARESVGDVGGHWSEVRDATAVEHTTVDLRQRPRLPEGPPRRGVHRRQGDLGWSDPLPGPRHGR